MKRFAILALVAAFVLGVFGTAMAETEFSFSGSYQATFQWYKSAHSAFQKDVGDDTFHVQQRIRLYVNAATSETNKVTLGFEMDDDWGDNTWQLGGDSTNTFEIKRGMLQFVVPNTQLTVLSGLQGLALPSAVAVNTVYNMDAASLAAVYPFADNFTATALWVRAVDDGDQNGLTAAGADAQTNGEDNTSDEYDVVGAILNITPVEGFNIQPYYVVSMVGAGAAGNQAKDEDGWWLGAAMSLTMFDPITILADFDMGSYDGANDSRDMGGWQTDIQVSYAMDMFTPAVLFHYGTGHDGDVTDGTEMLPVIAADTSYNVSNFGTGDGRGRSVDGLLTGVTNTSRDAAGTAIAGATGSGVWALGGKLLGISLVENLTTDLAVIYYEGTNDKDAVAGLNAITAGSGNSLFTEKDSAWEINVNNTYAMYEELSVLIDFGYVSTDYDTSLGTRGNDYLGEDAYKFMIGLEYAF